MIDQLLQLDRHFFYIINHGLSNPFFDWLMPILRQPKLWIPLYVFIFCFCIYRYKKTGAYIVVLLAITVGLSDFGSGVVGKHLVKRLRPCNDAAMAQTIITRIPCGSGFSFPSAHASNHFAIALFLSLVFSKRWKWIWFIAILWAATICLAQVYVGVHYPFDVTFGALYGMLVAYLIYLLFKKLQPQF
ncbi:phosphatase PAP2 family protein [Mucilaginibacter paludis]|uniref:Phosphoesterase PA-phosphatase related protein n=1 Tax=Mucilaginibacter paludis DSM 18603 TaxID=714943 RepID=H1Y8Z7_9SPHI|nr:phosphatase PAP2 family protein [Mucilaginibacter paludis]EHQ29035.1 phosphoesterase PA-phosphatase related protein [Mucilaginibacter paludis DSM 18603]